MPKATTVARPVAACQHHWIVETPAGSSCEGRCKKCGETKHFATVISNYDPSSRDAYSRRFSS